MRQWWWSALWWEDFSVQHCARGLLSPACYSYALSRTVQVRFVPPKDVKVHVSQGIIRTRVWDAEKLVAFLQVGLEPLLSTMIEDLELEVVVAKSSDIRFNWKPEKIGALRNAIGEMIGTVMEEIEVDEFLSE